MSRKLDFSSLPVDLRQDYLNIDGSIAISAEGMIFKVGDTVAHQGGGDSLGIISSFYKDEKSFDIIARTSQGHGRIAFMYHINN